MEYACAYDGNGRLAAKPVPGERPFARVGAGGTAKGAWLSVQPPILMHAGYAHSELGMLVPTSKIPHATIASPGV